VLTPTQLAFLAAVQDRLIPREGELPGAGEAGGALVVDRYLAERAAWRPDVLAVLQAIDVAAGAAGRPSFLDLSGAERDAVLHAVEAAHPRLFRGLVRLTYAAYYTDAGVQRARGVTAAPPLPGGHTLPPFDESRLEPVRRRGKLWRDA
jgi:hypothetical protein